PRHPAPRRATRTPAGRPCAHPPSGVAASTPGRLLLDYPPGRIVHLLHGQAEPVPENPEPFAAGPGNRLLQMLVDLRAHGHLTVGACGRAHQRGEPIGKVGRDRRAKLRAYSPGGWTG